MQSFETVQYVLGCLNIPCNACPLLNIQFFNTISHLLTNSNICDKGKQKK